MQQHRVPSAEDSFGDQRLERDLAQFLPELLSATCDDGRSDALVLSPAAPLTIPGLEYQRPVSRAGGMLDAMRLWFPRSGELALLPDQREELVPAEQLIQSESDNSDLLYSAAALIRHGSDPIAFRPERTLDRTPTYSAHHRSAGEGPSLGTSMRALEQTRDSHARAGLITVTSGAGQRVPPCNLPSPFASEVHSIFENI
ncbi:hypothetical protein WJX73_005061 [Symbiochloris irregularis]|uniref:Uncharacterized protein n=1 Tax=Symbiochloris irregularis TaxID=706552 RepID=A0AAW1P338_9CHLO